MSVRNLFGTPARGGSVTLVSSDGSVEVTRNGDKYDLKAKGGLAGELGNLSYKDSVDYAVEVTNKPDLTLWARWDQLSDLATQSQVDWNMDIKNAPDLDVFALKDSLGTLAAKNTVDYLTDVINKPVDAAGVDPNQLGTLAFKNTVDWRSDVTDIDLYPQLQPKLVGGTGIGIAANAGARTLTISNTAPQPDLSPYAKTTDLTVYLKSADAATAYQALHAVLTGLSSNTQPLFFLPITTRQIAPAANAAHDLGTTALRWNNTYVTNLDVSGTLTADIYAALKPKLVAGTNVSVVANDVAKTITITNTAAAPDLSPYAKTTDLTVYAKTTDLAPYARTTDLAPYATTAAVSASYQPLHAVLTGLASGAPAFTAVLKTVSVIPSATNTSNLGGTANRYLTGYFANLDFSGTLTGDIYPNLKPRFLAGTNIGLAVDDVGKTITVNNTRDMTPYATTAAVAAGYQPLHTVLNSLSSVTPTLVYALTTRVIQPSATDAYSLGTTALRYSNAYLTNLDFTGNLTGSIYPNLVTTLQAGAGITLTPNATSKTLTITNSKTPVDLSGNDVFGILPASKVDLSQVKISTTTRNITTTSGTTTVNTTNRTVPETAFTSNAGNVVSGLTMTCTANTGAVDAWKVFDGNGATYWRGTSAYGYFMSAESYSSSAIPGGTSDYLNVTWSGGTVVPKQLSYYVANYNDQPAVLVVLGSNNGSTWTTITTFAPYPRFAAGTWIGVTLPNTTAYSQLRIRIDGWYGDSNVTPPGTNVYCSLYGLTINADVGISTTTQTTTTTPTTVPYLNQPVIDSPQLNGTTSVGVSEVISPTNADNILRVGRYRTVDGYSWIEFHGTGSGNDWARFQRNPGVAGDAYLVNTGGHLNLQSAAGKYILTSTSALIPATTNATQLGSSANAWTNVNAYSYVTVSDEREKTSIAPLADGLDLINALQPITFQYKSGTDQRTRMGLGAHRTKEVMDAAGKAGYGLVETSIDPWGVNYQELVAPLIGAIQTLTKQVSDLRTRVGVLEQKTARLPII